MDIKQFEYFLNLCESKSFSASANELFISQQGLSASMKKLEEELGVQLFARTSKGITPNDYAQAILPYARDIVQKYDQLTSKISHALNNISGTFVLDVNRRLLDSFPHGTQIKIEERFPNINAIINDTDEKNAMRRLLDEKINMAMVSGPVDETIFDETILMKFNYVAIVNENNHLYHRTKITFEDLKVEQIVIASQNNNMYDNFIKQCKKNNFDPNICMLASDAQHLLFLCMENEGIGITSTFYSNYFPIEKIRIIPIIEENYEWTIEIITKKGQQLPMAEKIWKDYIVSISK